MKRFVFAIVATVMLLCGCEAYLLSDYEIVAILTNEFSENGTKKISIFSQNDQNFIVYNHDDKTATKVVVNRFIISANPNVITSTEVVVFLCGSGTYDSPTDYLSCKGGTYNNDQGVQIWYGYDL